MTVLHIAVGVSRHGRREKVYWLLLARLMRWFLERHLIFVGDSGYGTGETTASHNGLGGGVEAGLLAPRAGLRGNAPGRECHNLLCSSPWALSEEFKLGHYPAVGQ